LVYHIPIHWSSLTLLVSQIELWVPAQLADDAQLWAVFGRDEDIHATAAAIYPCHSTR